MQNAVLIISIIMASLSFLSILFTVFNAYKKPQEDANLTSKQLRNDIDKIKEELIEVKTTHLRTVEEDLRNLTKVVNDLSLSVATLSTIINERIPKASPNLTPPGM